MPEPKARELAAEPTAEGLETRPLRNPRRGMYVLPSLFTAGNIAAGFYAIMQSVQGSAAEPEYYNRAALAIGFAVLFDGLDGRIARMTNTSSEFGKELDSLADVITFGVAPSVLAYIWGFRLLPHSPYHDLRERIVHIGVFVCFLFDLRGEPAGAVQYQRQSAAAQSGAAGQQVLRRHADSGGRGGDCGGHPLL
jgi:CDP-diacylglycerol--serine O-phosphatidyltransferase